MSPADRIAGYRLLAAGGAVPFRIVAKELSSGNDEGDFDFQVELQFLMDDEEVECNPEDLVEHAAFGFIFAIASLSFSDAWPRESSAIDYFENDEFRPSDMLQGLRFVRGELRFCADCVRARKIKTEIVLRRDGTVTLKTAGRGKAAITVNGSSIYVGRNWRKLSGARLSTDCRVLVCNGAPVMPQSVQPAPG